MSECVVRMDIDEMPTACGPCKLSCTAICKEWTKVDRKEIGRTKSPNCPILAILPEGHGRLVDADALADDVRSLWDYKTVDGITATTVLNQTLTDIRNCPTIVPADTAERSET